MRSLSTILRSALFGFVFASSAQSKEFHVAPSPSGAFERSLYGAVRSARAGDTIWLQAGTYRLCETLLCHQSGTSKSRIRIAAKKDETVILDFSGNPSVGILISGAYWIVSNISIQGSGQFGLEISGIGAHHNLIDCTVVRSNSSTGLVISKQASNNLVYRCDSYLNFDAQSLGENGDGFGAYFGVGPGNRFLECQSWNNSDDGFDLWEAGNSVTLERCLTWANGLDLWGMPEFRGDGNGFKLGRGRGAHVLVRCIAWDLPGSGFDLNGNASGVTLLHCAALRCGLHNFALMNSFGNIERNVLRNNLSLDGRLSIDYRIDDYHNSWNFRGAPLRPDHFKSLEVVHLRQRRRADGSLITGRFLQPRRLSPVVNAGLDLGLPYIDSAPDIGPFEYAPLWQSFLKGPANFWRKLQCRPATSLHNNVDDAKHPS